MEVWEEIASNPSAGAQRLVEEYGDRLYTAAFLMCQNAADAEDLVFRTFSRVVAKIGGYRGRASFFSWLYSILLNFRRMDLRRKGANALVFEAEIPDGDEDPGPNPYEALAAKADAAEIQSAIVGLPESLREVVVLRFYEDMGMDEMAEALGIPVGTVKFRLHRAKKVLADVLSGKLFPETGHPT